MVLNYLVASSIWHILKAHTPNEGVIKSLQGKLFHHFWLGQRWVPEITLYPTPNEGGFGLVHVATKLQSFHLTHLKSIVCKQNSLMAVIFQQLLDWQVLTRISSLSYRNRPTHTHMVRRSLCISKHFVETKDAV